MKFVHCMGGGVTLSQACILPNLGPFGGCPTVGGIEPKPAVSQLGLLAPKRLPACLPASLITL